MLEQKVKEMVLKVLQENKIRKEILEEVVDDVMMNIEARWTEEGQEKLDIYKDLDDIEENTLQLIKSNYVYSIEE